MLTGSYIYSQNKQLLSFFVNAGVSGNHKYTSFRTGFDMEARNYKFGVFLSGSYAVGDRNKVEVSVGPRWYIGNLKKISGTIETGLGYYATGEFKNGGLGISIGGGVNYSLTNITDLNMKTKYHVLGAYFEDSYGEIFLGLRYYFNK
jgi:hypothetical protein